MPQLRGGCSDLAIEKDPDRSVRARQASRARGSRSRALHRWEVIRVGLAGITAPPGVSRV